MENLIKIMFKNFPKNAKEFFLDEKNSFPFIILVLMTALLFYNDNMIMNSQKIAYESDKIADELRDSSEDLTKYVREFVSTGNKKYEKEYWHVLAVRNGEAPRSDGRKIPLNVIMKQLGFTDEELKKLKEAQDNSDKLVKKEVIAMNAIKGINDKNVSKLIKPKESKRDFAIRILNDESYHKDKATIMNPINDVVQMVDKRTQVKLLRYNILNFIYMLSAFLVVYLLFFRFIFFIVRNKKNIEREKVIRKIIEIMRSSIGINSVKNRVVNEIGVFFQADRVFFADYNPTTQNFYVAEDSEYRSSKRVISYAGNEVAITHGIVDAMKKFPLRGKDLIFSDLDKYLRENDLTQTDAAKIFKDMGCMSMIGVHIAYQKSFYGDIVVTFGHKRKIDDDDINFVITLANQAGIAIYQAELYEKEKAMREKESLLRKIFETMRSSLEINKIKNTIVSEVGNAFKADRCFLWEYDKSMDFFVVDEFSEYKSSENVKSLSGNNSKEQQIQWLTDCYKNNQCIFFNNIEQFIKENNLAGTSIEEYFKKYDVKSSYNIPIFNDGDILGVLIVQYTNDYTNLSVADIDFLKIVAVQAGEAIYQAKLYQEVQLQAERERISRNIIEILRSSMDEEIIKKLFVKNIGKFFNADRVFFSDYDPIEKVYLPVDENSEYLSNSNQKSFIGFDWSNAEINDYVQPLLERREIKIVDFDKSLKDNPDKSKGLTSRYADFDVKSSYNFPVLHQDNIIGYFCIEFTDGVNNLSEEDINRVRSICTQAGIALHHAKIYIEAQSCALSKETSVSELSEQIIKPAIKILDTSILLSKNEYDRSAQIENLNVIIESCKQLLELTKDIL